MYRHRSLVAVSAIVLGISALVSAAGPSEVADAVMKGDRAALRALLQRKADVNAPRVDGATALHWAVYRDDLDAADLLIRAGAKVDVANPEGITPVAMASLYGNVSMVEQAARRPAPTSKQRGPNGQTLLMLAARNGRPETIKTLVAAGAEVNAKETLARHDGVDVGGGTEASRGGQGAARCGRRSSREIGSRRTSEKLHGRSRERGAGAGGGETSRGGGRGRADLRGAT